MSNKLVDTTVNGDFKRCLVDADGVVYDLIFPSTATEDEMFNHANRLAAVKAVESEADRVQREIEENTDG